MEEQVYNVFPIMEKAVGYILGGLFIVSLPLAIREYISLRKFKKEMKEREKIRKESVLDYCIQKFKSCENFCKRLVTPNNLLLGLKQI